MANVRDFEYIAEIARYGSISKAAEALYLSQPTLTKFLQRVEREAGQPLFHRVGKRFVLTPAGEVYVARAKSILQLEHQLEQELADLAAMRSGSIRLGTTAGRSSYIARQVAPLFRQEFPGVRLLLHISHTERLMKMMQNNELDMALANCDQDFPALSADPIGEDEMVLVVPANSPLVDKARRKEGFRFPVIGVEHWREEPFVLSASISHSYSLAMDYFRELGITPIAMGNKELWQAIQLFGGMTVQEMAAMPFDQAFSGDPAAEDVVHSHDQRPVILEIKIIGSDKRDFSAFCDILGDSPMQEAQTGEAGVGDHGRVGIAGDVAKEIHVTFFAESEKIVDRKSMPVRPFADPHDQFRNQAVGRQRQKNADVGRTAAACEKFRGPVAAISHFRSFFQNQFPGGFRDEAVFVRFGVEDPGDDGERNTERIGDVFEFDHG